MANSFERAVEKASGDSAYALGYIIGGLIGGALLGWISFYISAWILSMFGSGFLNGKAKADKFRTVLAWGSIPSTVSVVFSFIIVILYGIDSLNMNAELSMIEGVVFLVFGLIQLGLGIWSIYIITQGIMHIQNFSVGKALLNLFLPIIVLIVIIAVIVGVVSL